MSDGMSNGDTAAKLLDLTAGIVAAYVSNNSVPLADLQGLIGSVHGAVTQISSAHVVAPDEAPKEPAVPIKKSVTKAYIICLEDGEKFKSLRRHLSTSYGLTPDAYRAKWGLPPDYPMVAPDYSAARSQLAKAAGLGVQRTKAKSVTSQTKVSKSPRRMRSSSPERAA